MVSLRSLKRQGSLPGHQCVVFLNSGKGDSPKLLKDAVRKLHTQPVLSGLQILAHAFPYTPRFGEIRGLLLDAVVIAALRSGLKDPVVISTDSDIQGFAPGFVKRTLRLFEINPGLDFSKGRLFWCQEPTRFPEMFFAAEFWDVNQDARIRNGQPMLLPGPNTLMRLASYCAIGGMDYASFRAEDDQLSARLHLLGRRVTYEKDLFVIGSPRRWFHLIENDYRLTENARTVTKLKGSRMDLSALERRYLSDPQLIQERHIRKAVQGDARALTHISARLKRILQRAAQVEKKTTSSKTLAWIAARLGWRERLRPRDVKRIFHVENG